MIFLNLQGFDIQESVFHTLFSILILPLLQRLFHPFLASCHSGLKTPIFPICPVFQPLVQFTGLFVVLLQFRYAILEVQG